MAKCNFPCRLDESVNSESTECAPDAYVSGQQRSPPAVASHMKKPAITSLNTTAYRSTGGKQHSTRDEDWDAEFEASEQFAEGCRQKLAAINIKTRRSSACPPRCLCKVCRHCRRFRCDGPSTAYCDSECSYCLGADAAARGQLEKHLSEVNSVLHGVFNVVAAHQPGPDEVDDLALSSNLASARSGLTPSQKRARRRRLLRGSQ